MGIDHRANRFKISGNLVVIRDDHSNPQASGYFYLSLVGYSAINSDNEPAPLLGDLLKGFRIEAVSLPEPMRNIE